MPTLISPVDDLRDAFAAMATEFADQGEPRYMVEAKDFSAYLAALRDRERGEGLPPGWVSDSHFWLVDEARIVGCSRLRHRLTPALQREGGHIGYDVRPSERRKVMVRSSCGLRWNGHRRLASRAFGSRATPTTLRPCES